MTTRRGEPVIERIDATAGRFDEQLLELRRMLSPQGDVVSEAGRARTIAVFGEPLTPRQVVQRICRDIREEGISALLRYTEQLDGKSLSADTLRVPRETLEAAHAAVDSEFLRTVRAVRDRIAMFQTSVVPRNATVRRDGVTLQQRVRPLERVGICVPGGAAAYPSTLLMTAVPAQVAGVRQLAVMAPPTPFGSENRQLLAVCHELGIDCVYRMGGAQGVAALAYGVDGVEPVDMIVGPGNLFVALAKQSVFGQVAIDSIAGPSEVVIVADDTADANWVAADLLAQAEHAPGASFLVTWSDSLLDRVESALAQQLGRLQRADVTRQSLIRFGRLIRARDAQHAVAIARSMAPEHLHVQTADARSLADQLDTAGALFIGRYATVALGDYVAGPSHVLPTGGTARWASGLSAATFVRTHSVIEYQPEGLTDDAPLAMALAEREGLTAHRESIAMRLGHRSEQDS